MYLYLKRLYLYDPIRSVELETDRAGVTCDGSDHDLQGWVADAYFSAEKFKTVTGRNCPFSIRMVTVEDEILFGKAFIRRESASGSHVYIHLAGISPLLDSAGRAI